MIFRLDKDAFSSWNPRHSFVEKLSKRLSVEVSDFYLGLETGYFLRKDKEDYSGHTVSKKALRELLYERGVEEDEFLRSDENLGTRYTLSRYASMLSMPLSAMIRLSESGDEDSRPSYTDISGEYYTKALDAAVLIFLFMAKAVTVSVAYLDMGLADFGWNPTLSSLNKICESSGLSLEAIARAAKAEEGIVPISLSGGEYVPITCSDVRSELFRLFGTDNLSFIARECGEEYDRTYQLLRRKDEKAMTVLSLLGYLEVLGISLPEFFHLCQERKR